MRNQEARHRKADSVPRQCHEKLRELPRRLGHVDPQPRSTFTDTQASRHIGVKTFVGFLQVNLAFSYLGDMGNDVGGVLLLRHGIAGR